MLRKWLRVGAAAMLFSIGTCVGCANEQETARGAVPASFPATVDHWNDGKLDHVEFLQKFQLSDYSKVVVAPCDTSAVTLPAKDSNTFEPVNSVLAHSTDLLAEGLRSKLKGIVPVETGPAPAAGGPRVLLIQPKVKEMEPGSAAARFWVGMGTGGAYTAIEGQIADSQTGQPLIRFQNGERRSDFARGYEGLLSEEVTATGEALGVLLEAFAAR